MFFFAYSCSPVLGCRLTRSTQLPVYAAVGTVGWITTLSIYETCSTWRFIHHVYCPSDNHNHFTYHNPQLDNSQPYHPYNLIIFILLPTSSLFLHVSIQKERNTHPLGQQTSSIFPVNLKLSQGGVSNPLGHPSTNSLHMSNLRSPPTQ